MAILSVLWLGHPRLAGTDKNISEDEVLETFVEVLSRFQRLQHYPLVWKKLMELADDDQWVQNFPQQVCHLIVG